MSFISFGYMVLSDRIIPAFYYQIYQLCRYALDHAEARENRQIYTVISICMLRKTDKIILAYLTGRFGITDKIILVSLSGMLGENRQGYTEVFIRKHPCYQSYIDS